MGEHEVNEALDVLVDDEFEEAGLGLHSFGLLKNWHLLAFNWRKRIEEQSLRLSLREVVEVETDFELSWHVVHRPVVCFLDC